MSRKTKELTEIQAMELALKEAKAEARAKTVSNRKVLAMRVEIAKLTRDSDPQIQVKKLANEVLDSILAKLELIPDLKVKKVFGYGFQPSKIISIARTLKYAKGASKGEAIEDSPRFKANSIVSYDEEVVDMIDTFAGNSAYFSEQTLEFVEAIPCNIGLLKQAVESFGLDLGIEVDTSTMLESTISAMFDRNYKRAKELEKNTIEFAEENSDIQYDD